MAETKKNRRGRPPKGQPGSNVTVRGIPPEVLAHMAADLQRLGWTQKRYFEFIMEVMHSRYVPRIEALLAKAEGGQLGPGDLEKMLETLGED